MINDITEKIIEEQLTDVHINRDNPIYEKNSELLKFQNISTESIWKKFHLKEINLEVFRGEKVLVLGENGSGKTTFFNLLSGKESIIEKNYVFKLLGYNYNDDYSWFEINKKMIFLSRLKVNWSTTLEENLLFASNGDENKVKNFNQYLNIDKYKGFKWNELSDGYKSRYLIAYALLSNPELLILDEPFGTLDNESLIESLKIINSKDNSNITMFFSSHNYLLLETIIDKFIIFKEGRLDKVYTKKSLQDTSQIHLEVKVKGNHDIRTLSREQNNLYKVKEYIPILRTYYVTTSKKNDFLKFLLNNEIEIISIVDITSSIKREYRSIVE